MINKKDESEIKEEEAQNERVENVEKVEEVEGDELVKCKENVRNLENQVKRVLADYQNLEKRVRDEKSEWVKMSGKNILLRLLPILDTLLLAAKHVDNQGLTLSIQQFLDTLKDEGVVKIETKGRDFDPHTMECVETVEGKDGKVVDEVRSGFMMYDKILRPSQVSVGKE